MSIRFSAAALVSALVASSSQAAPVRIFAVGHKLHLADAVDQHAFHDKMAALMDATFPGRATLVQAGVEDVASHLRPADPVAPELALVAFPEDTGLVASLIGSRGMAARQQSIAAGAIVFLLTPYAAQRAHYDSRFPGQPLIRSLALALTDTLYRSVYETFRELATTYRVYLAVSANMAPARRVEAATEPDLVALLRDPDEPTRTYAYEAVSPHPYNTAMVFTPDGEILVPDGDGSTLLSPSQTGGILRGSTNKAYLTPIEQPPPGNDAGLALATGAVRDLEVLPTPVGRLGIVISKDAWMIDVNDRFLAKRANVILQPEAFSSWAYDTTEWAPDVFTEGGFANLQKNAAWIVNVAPCLTGNLLDVTFDGQTTIIGRERKGALGTLSPNNAWVGQNPSSAYLATGPWIIDDPGTAAPALTLAERRAALAAQGMHLLPGSPPGAGVPCPGPLAVGTCENGYRESIVWADVVLPDDAVTAPVDPTRARPSQFGSAVRVNGPEPVAAAQQAPRVAARDNRIFVVWHEARGDGLENVWLAISRDAGKRFGAPIRVSDNAAGTVAEINPAIAVRGKRIALVWQEFAFGLNDDVGRIKLAHFDDRGRKRGPDVRVDDDSTAGKWVPAVAFSGSTPVVTWIDERDPGPDGVQFEHVYAARGLDGGIRFAPAVRVDQGTPVALALHNDNKWAPTIAADGRDVHIAWVDFNNYSWDLFTAASADAAATFGPSVRVDDAGTVDERLHERPSLALGARGTIHLAWTDLRARKPNTNVFHAGSTDQGAHWTANRSLGGVPQGFDPNTQRPTNQWHPSLAAVGRSLFAAWQDDRLGNPDIFFTSSRDDGGTFTAATRVDDTGDGQSNQTRPSLAVSGRGRKRMCYVAWEDDRDGTSDIYLARSRCGSR